LRGTAIRIVIGASLVTALLLVLAVAVPGQRTLFIGVYLLVLGAFVLTALVRSFRTLRRRAWERSVFDRRPEEPEQALPIDDLVARAVSEAVIERFDFPVVGSKVNQEV